MMTFLGLKEAAELFRIQGFHTQASPLDNSPRLLVGHLFPLTFPGRNDIAFFSSWPSSAPLWKWHSSLWTAAMEKDCVMTAGTAYPPPAAYSNDRACHRAGCQLLSCRGKLY